MESNHIVALEVAPQPADMRLIVNGLMEFNKQHTNGASPEHVLVTVRDDQNLVVGGLLGATYLGWLQIHSVWLPDALRGKDLGKKLMAVAEDEALRRGCSRVFLETYSFQALPFYLKCGYKVFSHLPDFPVGGSRYSLTKDLSGAS